MCHPHGPTEPHPPKVKNLRLFVRPLEALPLPRSRRVLVKTRGVERIFLVLYAIEALLRFAGFGCAVFKDLWFLRLS